MSLLRRRRSLNLALLAGALAALAAACERRSDGRRHVDHRGHPRRLLWVAHGRRRVVRAVLEEGAELAVEEINNAGGLLRAEDPAPCRRRPEQARRGVQRRHQARHAGQGRRRARRSGEPPDARGRAGGAAVQGADDHARVHQREGDGGRRLHLPRLLHRSVSGRSAREVRLQRSEGAKVAVLNDIQQDYSVGLTDSVDQDFKALGGTVLAPVSYSSGDADFRAMLTQIRSQRPDAIFATGYYPEAAIIVRQARELGMTDADPRRRRLGRRRAEERPRGAREHLHLEPLLRRQSGSRRPDVRQGVPGEVQQGAGLDCRAWLRRGQGARRRHHPRRHRPRARSCATPSRPPMSRA